MLSHYAHNAAKSYYNLLFLLVNIRILCLFLPDCQGQSSIHFTARVIKSSDEKVRLIAV